MRRTKELAIGPAIAWVECVSVCEEKTNENFSCTDDDGRGITAGSREGIGTDSPVAGVGNRVYGDRSYRVSNVVGSNVVGGGILPTEPPMTTSTFKWATEDRLAKLEQRLEQMQQTIDQQKDDILNSLRSRVNNFTLD